eukprot:CAMPEP_0194268572 /NCGR_PEP_ID=MMETSP0169-20130528/2875_1 /TAXON_ID=218684 /ORGANISM="Corethron pennatum, Strain L29A3" /LENGTH=271 /DNA_ID=CAMNT_0039009851 /DNA_START=50 /DNA_END=865 /DNA_ORIENTATION=-
MFKLKIVARICFGILVAVSVAAIYLNFRFGGGTFIPDGNGVVNIPKGSEYIPDCDTLKAVNIQCYELKAVNIPASVQNLGSNSFNGAAVSVRGSCWVTPDEDGVVNISDGTDTIPAEVFYLCDALKEVTIPASVQKIGSYSFGNTDHLEKVIFEEGSQLEVIGQGAFYGVSLQVMTFPAHLKEIGKQAFYNSGLEEVIFEEGSELEVIGFSAFYNNENLKSINIPPGIKIGADAFAYTGCPKGIFTPGTTIVDCKIPQAERENLGGNGYDL